MIVDIKCAGLDWRIVTGASFAAVQGCINNVALRVAVPGKAFVFAPSCSMLDRVGIVEAVRREIRQRYPELFTAALFRVGRHLLVFGDGGADHCRRCGEFSHALLDEGEPTECMPVRRGARWWPQYAAQAS